MSERAVVTASYVDFGAFLAALKRLRAEGHERFSVYSPVPLAHCEEWLPKQGSPIRWYALAAGIGGGIGGFALSLGSALFFSTIVGGKPVASWVPFCVIAFELTVLAAGLTTMATCLLRAGLYPRGVRADYRAAFSADEFGISVPCGEEDRAHIQELLGQSSV
jgi:molybdopterin-containing oxidoreductase family membrane subunit